MSTVTIGAHRRRPVRFIRLIERNGWRVKLYGIAQGRERPDAPLLDLAETLAWQTLPVPAVTKERYGVGFVAVHQADMFNQIIVDWWERENELRHRVFKAEPNRPTDFKEITASGEAFCVWELRILSHERDSWVVNVLEGKGNDGIEAYLRDRLEIDC